MDQDIIKSLSAIAKLVNDGLSEDEVERLFQPFYEALGYTTIGGDIRGKKKGDGGIPDVLLLKDDESIHVTVELKKPSEDLADHEGQLLGYMNSLHASWGILGNGKALWLYKREHRQAKRISQHTIHGLIKDPSPLADLVKPSFNICDIQNIKDSLDEFAVDPIEILEIEGIGAQSFLTSQKMTPSSPFGELILSMYALLDELNKSGASKFTVGAYEFWDKVYKRPLKKENAPALWKGMFAGGFDVSAFMFCLEASYSITSRLLLAKTVQDHDSDGKIVGDHLTQRVINHLSSNTLPRSQEFDPVEIIEAVSRLFDHYASALFSSIYSQDIFDWWRDFKGAPKDKQDAFAKALGRILLSLSRFDFTNLDGDILGELYQAYFDPETRKELGEFYTPPEVVDFILDQCEYKGKGRLLDPSCGSGTFLIAALRKYLESRQNDDPCKTIREITGNFPLVGFDVNPFAVMMAQVNFAAILVPVYAKAVEKDKSIMVHRLPIIRTDSLRQELIEYAALHSGKQLGLNMGADIDVHIELPVKTAQGPLDVTLNLPKLERAKETGHILNEREWLRAIQSIFASVQQLGIALDANTPIPNLPKELEKAIGNIGGFDSVKAKALTKFLIPYADHLWVVLKDLKTKHDDGRFLKTMEDLMMGVVLKHHVKYSHVVGNPPYIRIQKIPAILKNHWQDNYEWAEGNYDAFIPFVERSLAGDNSWLDEQGRFGMITSNRFLNTDYATKLRKHLPECAVVDSLTDFGAAVFKPDVNEKSARLFKDAMVYPAIIVATKSTENDKSHDVKSARFMPTEIKEDLKSVLRKVKAEWNNLGAQSRHAVAGISPRKPYVDVFLTKSQHLYEDGWFFMPDTERTPFETLTATAKEVDPKVSTEDQEKTRRLDSYTITSSGTFQGCVTGKDSVFILHDRGQGSSPGLRRVWCKENDQTYEIEESIMRPFIEADDVQKWHVRESVKWILFPYVQRQDGIKLMASQQYKDKTIQRGKKTVKVFEGYSPQEFIEFYPKAWAYFQIHEAELRKRESGKHRKGKKDEWRWYDLARPQSLNATSALEKIVIGNNATLPKVAIDSSKALLAAGGTAGVNGIAAIDLLNPLYLAGLLGSQVSEFFVKQTSSVFSGGYYSYGDQVLKNFPVPKATKKQADEIASVVTSLQAEHAKLFAIESQIARFPDSATEEMARRGKHPDRDTVENLVGFSDKFPATLSLEDMSDSKAAQMKTDGSVTISLTKNAKLEGGASAVEIVLAILSNMKSLGQRTVEKTVLQSAIIPEKASDQKSYIKQLETWCDERDSINAGIGSLNEKLNKLVISRYGIRGNDRKALLSFLKNY